MAHKKWLAVLVGASLIAASCGGDDEATDTTADSGTSAPDTSGATPTSGGDTTTPDSSVEPTPTDPPAEGFVVNTDDCEDPDAANAVIEGDIKIGTSLPLSGGPAALFAPFSQGYEAFFKYINETEGGVNGQQLVPIVKDDQFAADQTKAAVEALVFEDEVTLLSGIIGTANNAAVQADLNAQCIPQLWASTGAPNWGAVDTSPWTTGLLVPYSVETKVFLEFVKQEKPDAATAGLFYVNNEFGQAYAEAFKEQVAEYGIEIVSEQTIDAADGGAPSGQLTNLAADNPDIVLAVPLGAQCIAFMGELGNVKAANADFDPLVYQTATCAVPPFFLGGGPGADGVYTSANLVDVNNPANADLPAVTTYLDAFKSVSPDGNPGGFAVAGWLAAELTYATLVAASDACPDGITRACIINAARNINYTPSMFREGLSAVMGPDDGYVSEGTQIIQWSAADQVFVDVGDVINIEGTTGVYDPEG